MKLAKKLHSNLELHTCCMQVLLEADLLLLLDIKTVIQNQQKHHPVLQNVQQNLTAESQSKSQHKQQAKDQQWLQDHLIHQRRLLPQSMLNIFCVYNRSFKYGY